MAELVGGLEVLDVRKKIKLFRGPLGLLRNIGGADVRESKAIIIKIQEMSLQNINVLYGVTVTENFIS